MPSQSVLVIGGGLAGLSCAVALAEAGLRVRLLEKRPHLGGRATSYMLPDGSEVDNCQHVTLGCCTNLADFYRRVGAADKIRYYSRLYFVDARGRRSEMEAAPLPPPLHMAPSFLLLDSLTFADKRSIARGLMAIAKAGGHPTGARDASMLDWLRGMEQTPGAIERFWRVVLVSALDEELGRTDARYGIDVFWKGFLANRAGYCVGIPTVPLAELYDGCRGVLECAGGEVRLRCGVREVRAANGRFAFAVLDDGSEAPADACVLCVPHDVLLELAPRALSRPGGPLEGLRHLETSPITGVHFWFDREVMREPFLTLLDHTTQWIFNKSLLSQEPAATVGIAKAAAIAAETISAEARPMGGRRDSGERQKGQYLQLVISASYGLVERSRQEIIDLCRRELADVLPATREANLVKATVIKEVHATFSPRPGVDRWRPKQKTTTTNLYLAGDWTSTGWPATMEGAVRSGYLAAEALLADFGRPAKLVQAELPCEGFSKFWAEGFPRRVSV
jgi:squalene-associated FAD-dependent desaturase